MGDFPIFRKEADKNRLLMAEKLNRLVDFQWLQANLSSRKLVVCVLVNGIGAYL
jgi:hypothetical protein